MQTDTIRSVRIGGLDGRQDAPALGLRERERARLIRPRVKRGVRAVRFVDQDEVLAAARHDIGHRAGPLGHVDCGLLLTAVGDAYSQFALKV